MLHVQTRRPLIAAAALLAAVFLVDNLPVRGGGESAEGPVLLAPRIRSGMPNPEGRKVYVVDDARAVTALMPSVDDAIATGADGRTATPNCRRRPRSEGEAALFDAVSLGVGRPPVPEDGRKPPLVDGPIIDLVGHSCDVVEMAGRHGPLPDAPAGTRHGFMADESAGHQAAFPHDGGVQA